MKVGSKMLGDFDRRIWVLFFGRIISATGFSIVMPFLSIYFYTNLHISMTTIGTVFLASSAIGALGNIVGGEIADRFGRKRVMIVAMASRAFIFAVLSLVIASGSGFVLIALLVICSSFTGSLFDPASNAMVADVCEPSRRLEAYSLLRIGQNIGWTVGPLLGGLLVIINYSSLFLLTAVTAFSVAFILLLLVSESICCTPEGGRSWISSSLHVLMNLKFLLFCLISVTLFLVVAQMSSVYSVYSENVVGIPVYEVGYLYAINGIMVVLIQVPVARLISKYRMTSAIAAGAAVYAAGYFGVAFVHDFLGLAIAMVIISMGEIITSPSSTNLVANMSPENERGRYMGVFGLFTSFGWSMGPFVGGLMMDAFVRQPLIMWGGIASFAVFAALGYLVLRAILSEQVDRVGARATKR
jgi:MFS family permease